MKVTKCIYWSSSHQLKMRDRSMIAILCLLIAPYLLNCIMSIYDNILCFYCFQTHMHVYYVNHRFGLSNLLCICVTFQIHVAFVPTRSLFFKLFSTPYLYCVLHSCTHSGGSCIVLRVNHVNLFLLMMT